VFVQHNTNVHSASRRRRRSGDIATRWTNICSRLPPGPRPIRRRRLRPHARAATVACLRICAFVCVRVGVGI